jgi:hypothetical protein
MNNEVRDGRGRLIGFRCWTCQKIAPAMWGETCNQCREDERRHQEMLAAIRTITTDGTAVRVSAAQEEQ